MSETIATIGPNKWSSARTGGKEKPVQLTTGGDVYKYELLWSPDSKKILWTDRQFRLTYADVESKKTTLVRKATVYTSGTAAMKLMTELEREQEQLCMLADMCIDAYTIDTVVRRAIQAQSEETEARAKIHLLLARVAAHEIYERAIARARRIVVELFPDDDQYTRFMELQRLQLTDVKPLLPLKRAITAAVLEADGYPLRY